MVHEAEVDPESGQGDGTTDAANRQQAAVEEQRREYCHLIRDISEDLKMCAQRAICPFAWDTCAGSVTVWYMQSTMGGRLGHAVLPRFLF